MDATLKDVTTSPNPPAAAPPVEPAKSEPPVALDTGATELGQLLIDAGYSKENINELLNSPQALNAIRYQIQNDPAEFVKSLERADPALGENFLEKTSDLYLARYAPKDAASKKGGGDGAKEVPNELMAEVNSLRERLAGFETREDARNRAASTAQVQSRYNSRVDELFNTDGVKALNLTKTEAGAMRAMLNQDLASDPAAVQRVSNGNFFDVPRRFQSILNDWSNDRKAAADADARARERSASGASPLVFDGPNPFSLEGVKPDVFNSWDTTEEAFGAALKKAGAGQ
jgi:hypothetical protein